MNELDNQDYFIRATEVAQKLTIAKSTLYLWISQGFFPKPTKFGRTAVWRNSTLTQWILDKEQESLTH